MQPSGGVPLVSITREDVQRHQHHHYSSANVFLTSRGAKSSLTWTLVFGILLGVTSLISLGVAIAYSVPWFPNDAYSYGWVFSVLNWITWPLFAWLATHRNAELNDWALGFCAVQFTVNLVLLLLQYTGAIIGELNLNNGVNAFSLFISVFFIVLNAVVLFALLHLVLGVRHLVSQYPDEELYFNEPSSLDAIRWMLVFSLLLALWCLLALALALMTGIPAWPTASVYDFGYVLLLPNYFLWLLFMAASMLRQRDVLKWALFLCSIQLLLNLLVFLLQLVGTITNLINLSAATGLFGLLASFGALFFTAGLWFVLLPLLISLV